MSQSDVLARFDLSGRVAVITGGAGLLGPRHANAIASAGGTPVLVDLKPSGAHYMEHFHAAGGMATLLRELEPLLMSRSDMLPPRRDTK